jgi:DNA/RNA-binding domain of Phe-tRNA-synthetase-like protein
MAGRVTIEAALRPLVRLGVAACEVSRLVEDDRELDEPLASAAVALRDPGSGADPGPARALYRAVGLDPTKTRPSSEALLRRVRRGEGLPRVNTAVDLGNWCSVEAQLPYGLYDLDRLEGPVELRRGRPGEAYAGIRKDEVHLEGRLTLADAHGPFGNPSADSARTMVTCATRRVLIVVFAPASVGQARLDAVVALTLARFEQYAGAVLSR